MTPTFKQFITEDRVVHKLKGSEPWIKPLIRATFPEYRGRLVRLVATDGPINASSYWDGGSRDYFAFVHIDTLRATSLAPAQSAYDRPVPGLDRVTLPPGVACVMHSIVMGKDRGITVYVRKDNVVNFLPTVTEEVDDLRAQQSAAEADVKAASLALKEFPRGAMGLTPDAVKASAEYKQAKAAYNTAFQRLRAINAQISKK
jgi:hypothetical protein